MAFYPGQKVLCVGGEGIGRFTAREWEIWARLWGVSKPNRGCVYTLRDVRTADDGAQRVRLMEIINPIVQWTDAPDQEPWFYGPHFRPLVERQTDITVFERLLVPAKQLEDA